MNVSGNIAKKHLREMNKQLRKELVKGISKMNSEESKKMFKLYFEKFAGGYRPKADLEDFYLGQKWNFDAFKKIMEKKPRKKPAPKEKPDPPKKKKIKFIKTGKSGTQVMQEKEKEKLKKKIIVKRKVKGKKVVGGSVDGKEI